MNTITGSQVEGTSSAAAANLRVTFWGVQGSCAISVEPREVVEFRRLLARDAIKRVVEDLRHKAARGGHGAVQRALDAVHADDAALDAYQRELGQTTLPTFGGETTCVSVETAAGDVLVFDGGSGIRNCGKHFVSKWGDGHPRSISLFMSHEHLDHRSGLPFSQFSFARPAFDVHVYGTRPCLVALDERYGMFSRRVTPAMHLDDPIDYRLMAARFTGTEFSDPEQPAGTDGGGGAEHWHVQDIGTPVTVGGATVRAFDVYHGPTRCLAYRVDAGPAAFVFCTDHELRHGDDPDDPRQRRSLAAETRLGEHCRGVDFAYFDGQYLLDEYLGRTGIGATVAVPRLDWGHSCVEDVQRRCHDWAIKRAVIGHHDPERGWRARRDLDNRLRSADGPGRIEMAKAEMVVAV